MKSSICFKQVKFVVFARVLYTILYLVQKDVEFALVVYAIHISSFGKCIVHLVYACGISIYSLIIVGVP